MLKILIVGGTFDHNNGKASRVIEEIAKNLRDPIIVNGGSLSKLKALVEGDWFIKQFNTIIWAPNIANDEEKVLHSLKKLHPRCILISTKQRRKPDEYTAGDIIGRLLKSHSNLGITFDTERKPFKMTVSDPLSNEYYSGYNIKDMTKKLRQRVQSISEMDRVGSSCIGEVREVNIDPDFISIIHKLGNEFSKHVNAVNPNRLLGNASTRCAKGFPAVRSLSDTYYVSKRNVDKENTTSSEFVEVMPYEDVVQYYGPNKPSVDTPIQIRLLNYYTNINYMIHGHVYVENGLETESKIPCGYVNEFDEIKALYPNRDTTEFIVNLKGHGCLIGVKYLKQFDNVKFFSRPFPEGDSMLVPAIPAEEYVPFLPTTPTIVMDGNQASIALFGGMGGFR